MFTVAPKELHLMLSQLGQALADHEQWFIAITRTLTCRLPGDESDIAEDAHMRCLFGQWYYREAPKRLRDHPGFHAIEAEHRLMHRHAATLLKAAASGNPAHVHDYDEFAHTLDRLRLQIRTLQEELADALHSVDPLTGTRTRTSMLTELREQQALVKRCVQQCAIVMMDLDHFKRINDAYGHQIGDRVLTASASYLTTHLRPYDKVFRYGGEEFLICLQDTSLELAFNLVERLRNGIANNPVDQGGGKEPIRITASFGIALLDADTNVEESMDRADKAPYSAKNTGRNRTVLWDPSM